MPSRDGKKGAIPCISKKSPCGLGIIRYTAQYPGSLISPDSSDAERIRFASAVFLSGRIFHARTALELLDTTTRNLLPLPAWNEWALGRSEGSGTGVPPVRIVQPTHGRDARATTVWQPDSRNQTLNTYLREEREKTSCGRVVVVPRCARRRLRRTDKLLFLPVLC